jgi:twitching motility two-component system response regulator PilH
MAKVLLVDDDRDILEFCKALLSNAGHDVFVAEEAISALATLKTQDIDLMITDANMPRHSGFDLIRAIKKVPRAKELITVMLTGRKERRDIDLALELGVRDYIVKPIDPLIFLQKIKALADSRDQTVVQTHEEPQFASTVLNSLAKAISEIEIYSVSEAGLVIRSASPFSEGAKVELDCDLFAKIGIDAPALRVVSSLRNGTSFETRIHFIGAKDATLTKIRAWVQASVLKKNRGAA